MTATVQEDHRVESKREIIRKSLNEIVQELEIRMREGGFNVPVFLTVPNSGLAVMTMATPADPSLEDWVRITDIICGAVSERLNGISLRSRALPCAMVNATMNAADVIAD
jgi:hypothetical protein